MEITQIIVLTVLGALSLVAYRSFERRFGDKPYWQRHTLMLLVIGIVAAGLYTPFTYPFSFWKTLPVFTIIPLGAFNLFYLLDRLFRERKVPALIRGLGEMLSLLSGSYIGMLIINALHIGIFMPEDIEVTLLIVLVFCIARLLISYAQLETSNRRNSVALKQSRIKEVQIQAQLELIQDKLNPHFLYNSLNSIAGLAMVDGQKTKDMTIALSKLLRFSLNYGASNFASIDEEIEILKTYLDVERVRFGDNLKIEISVADGSGFYFVPRFLIQPLVENCFKHAFKESDRLNFIGVDISTDRKVIEISIRDNGTPFPDKLTSGYGFKQATEKLELLFPGKHDFEVMNRPEKQVSIVIRELKKTE